MSWTRELARRGRLPDRLARLAVRRLALAGARRAEAAVAAAPGRRLAGVLERSSPPPLWRPGETPRLTPDDRLARPVLGRRGLEAAAHWPIWARDLDAAEEEMLGLVAERAALEPGHRTLVVARRRDAVAAFLAEEIGVEPVVWTPRPEDAGPLAEAAARRGLGGLEVRGGGLAESVEEAGFDRILAVESLPPVAPSFLALLGTRLRPGGRLFLQLACHRRYAWQLSAAAARWLHLDPGALVPATDLPPRFAPALVVHRHWELSGEHYERTARAWRRRLERRRAELLRQAAALLGEAEARRALDAWRLLLLARESLFGVYGGQEWWISHYALDRPRA